MRAHRANCGRSAPGPRAGGIREAQNAEDALAADRVDRDEARDAFPLASLPRASSRVPLQNNSLCWHGRSLEAAAMTSGVRKRGLRAPEMHTASITRAGVEGQGSAEFGVRGAEWAEAWVETL